MQQTVAGLSSFLLKPYFSVNSKLKQTDKRAERQTDRQRSRQTETGNTFLLLYKMIFNNKKFSNNNIDCFIYIYTPIYLKL